MARPRAPYRPGARPPPWRSCRGSRAGRIVAGPGEAARAASRATAAGEGFRALRSTRGVAEAGPPSAPPSRHRLPRPRQPQHQPVGIADQPRGLRPDGLGGHQRSSRDPRPHGGPRRAVPKMSSAAMALSAAPWTSSGRSVLRRLLPHQCLNASDLSPMNSPLSAHRTESSQNLAPFASRSTCTRRGSSRSPEQKKSRYGPIPE
jgi:hypothetical protein